MLLGGPAGTGKTVANCLRVYYIAKHYPGARCLIVRKTRESLTETVLVTWERDVLGFDHPILISRPVLRRVRQSYSFPNGSEVVVGGIDKPGKILSSEYDLIYVPEATDLTVEDWETLSGRLRSARVPYQQIIADCNPDTPHHWLYKRSQAGTLTRFDTIHQDNPRYWDREKGEWTSLGQQYLARLSRMTGTRRERFLLGKWVAAEGAVYAFDPAVHQLPAVWAPAPAWPRVWHIDWGDSSPTSMGLWAVDPDGRMHGYREVYQTHLRADKLGAWAKGEIGAGREPRPHGIVCDHDEDKKKAFERESGLALTMADKADRDKGIQEMQARFDLQEDGKPRIYLKADALAHDPDRFLVDAGRPTCGLEEVVGYVWNADFLKDEPIAENDHFCFVAGTLVETDTGPVPIERVRPGDRVLTRGGYQPVIAAGMTSPAATVCRAEFTDGRALVGTGNHPIWIETLGFLRMDGLRYNMTVSTVAENDLWKYKSCPELIASCGCGSRASSTAATRSPSRARIGTTSDPAPGMSSGGGRTYTATCGPRSMAPSRTATRLTTRTATRSTTRRTTCNCCCSPTTRRSTLPNSASGPAGGWRPCPLTSDGSSSRPPLPGTVPRPGGSGTVSSPKPLPLTCRRCGRCVSGAAASTRSRSTRSTGRDSARIVARPRLAGATALTTWTERASGAGPCSGSISTLPPSTARGSAPAAPPQPGRASGAAPCSRVPRPSDGNTAGTRVLTLIAGASLEPVYNLTVEGVSEFYANGILVHNCDGSRYAVRYCDKHFPSPASKAGADAYSKPKARAPGVDHRTGLPKHIFG